MKNYLWLIISGISAFCLLIFFLINFRNSVSIVRRLKKNKIVLLTDVFIFIIGLSNIAVVIYLLSNIKDQIDKFSSF